MHSLPLDQSTRCIVNAVLNDKCRRIDTQYPLFYRRDLEPGSYGKNNIPCIVNLPVSAVAAFTFVNGNAPAKFFGNGYPDLFTLCGYHRYTAVLLNAV